jgi:hypothetical protein
MRGTTDHVEIEFQRVEYVHDVQHDVRRAQHVAARVEQHVGGAPLRRRQDLPSASRTEAACWQQPHGLRHVTEAAGGIGCPLLHRRTACSDFILAMVTHWRTLMSSGQAALHCALPSQAPSHLSSSGAAAPPSRVSDSSSPTRWTAWPMSIPLSRAVGQASKHLPQVVQRSAAWATNASSLSA